MGFVLDPSGKYNFGLETGIKWSGTYPGLWYHCGTIQTVPMLRCHRTGLGVRRLGILVTWRVTHRNRGLDRVDLIGLIKTIGQKDLIGFTDRMRFDLSVFPVVAREAFALLARTNRTFDLLALLGVTDLQANAAVLLVEARGARLESQLESTIELVSSVES